MALEVPEAFLASERAHHPSAEERLFRLPQNHQQDLRDVARGVEESDAGVCCSYLVDSMSGEGADFEEGALLALERFAESAVSFDYVSDLAGSVAVVSRWRARVQRCRRALRLLRERGDGDAVSILHVAYGYPDPLARQLPELADMGALGCLVRYTDVVELRRIELVAEGTRLRARSCAAEAEDQGVVDLTTRRAIFASENGAVSSADALRHALSPFHEPAPRPRIVRGAMREDHCEVRPENPAELESRRAARKEREATHKERLRAFLDAARSEALRMLSRAEKAYHEAWLGAHAGTTSALRRGRALPRQPGLTRPAPVARARVRGAGWSST